jgi:hypothetical protein
MKKSLLPKEQAGGKRMFDPDKVVRWEDDHRDGTGMTVVEASDYDQLLKLYREALIAAESNAESAHYAYVEMLERADD